MAADSDATDFLGRGWAPSARLRATVFIVVGLLLVLHPLVGGLPDAVGLTGTAEYSAAEITPKGGDVDVRWLADRQRSVAGELYEHGGLVLIDCLPADLDPRDCALEATLIDRPASADLEPGAWSGYTYHGRFYERVAEETGGTVTLSLRPVAAETALGNVSVPATDWSETIHQAVEEGTVRAEPPLANTGVVLEDAGRYYVVVPTSDVPRDEPAGPLYTAAFTLVGLALVQRGRRLTASSG